MTLKDRVKLYTTGTAIKSVIKVLPKISDERWLSLVKGRVYKLKSKRRARFHGKSADKFEKICCKDVSKCQE